MQFLFDGTLGTWKTLAVDLKKKAIMITNHTIYYKVAHIHAIIFCE